MHGCSPEWSTIGYSRGIHLAHMRVARSRSGWPLRYLGNRLCDLRSDDCTGSERLHVDISRAGDLAMNIASFLQQSVPLLLVYVVGLTCFLMGGALAAAFQRQLQSKEKAHQRAFDDKARIASYVLLAVALPLILWQLLK